MGVDLLVVATSVQLAGHDGGYDGLDFAKLLLKVLSPRLLVNLFDLLGGILEGSEDGLLVVIVERDGPSRW